MRLNRFKKLEEYVSYDGGITYEPTGAFVKGDFIDNGEYNTITDCETPAIIPETVYRWLRYDYEEKYVCEGRDKYYLEYQQVSYNGGLTWENTGEERKGGVAVYDSDDCQEPDIPTDPIYRWVKQEPINEDNVICVNYRAYYKLVEEVSYDGGKTYTPTGNTTRGELYQINSTLCGFPECDLIEGDTRWVEVEDDYLCDGYKKTKKLQLERVMNCQWLKEQTYKIGDVIEENSADCGYEEYPDLPADSICIMATTNDTEQIGLVSLEYNWEKRNNLTYIDVVYITIAKGIENEIVCADNPKKIQKFGVIRTSSGEKSNERSMYEKIRFLSDIDLSLQVPAEFASGRPKMSFRYCYDLTELSGLEHLKIPAEQLTSLYYAFEYCKKLKKIDLSMFDLSYVKNLTYTFSNCESLEELIIPTLDGDKLTSLNNALQNCNNLKRITCKQSLKDFCYKWAGIGTSVSSKIGLTKEQLDAITWDIVG